MSNENRKNRNITFICILSFSIIFIGASLIINYGSQIEVERIATSNHVAEATITKVYCSDHGKVDYIYKVGSTTFSGSDYSCSASLCKDRKLGDKITVHYSGSDAGISRCGSVDKAESLILSQYIFLFFLFVVLLIAAYDNWRQRK